MRIQTASFSVSVMNTQCATSLTVRPQPRHTSSNVVEQTATQGVSGRLGGDADITAFYIFRKSALYRDQIQKSENKSPPN